MGHYGRRMGLMSPTIYPLVNIQKAIEAMTIEIVDFPSYKIVMFNSKL
jgi:hypothetical protein